MEDCRIAWLMSAAAKSEAVKATLLPAADSCSPEGDAACAAARTEGAALALQLLDGSRQARARQLAVLREAGAGESQDKVGAFELLLEFELAWLLQDTDRCAGVLRRAEALPAFGAANLRRLAKVVFTPTAAGDGSEEAGSLPASSAPTTPAAGGEGGGGGGPQQAQRDGKATATLQLAVLEACLRSSLNTPGATAADNWCDCVWLVSCRTAASGNVAG